ncbi:MAG: hypothetical protein ACJAYG_000399 [Oceanicoccus sp.]|jgi:hypothetical protein
MNKERSPLFTNVLANGGLIADAWRPSAGLLQRLAAIGLNTHFANGELRIQFVTGLQQQEVRNGNWEQLFEQFASQRAPQASSSAQPQANSSETYTPGSYTQPRQNHSHQAIAMGDDWRPSDQMVELIIASICPNVDYLNAQLISFSSHFFGQYNPNWDQQFKKWINNGWNVYGHKKNFAKNNEQDQRGFVEKHTDKSWGEGL